MGMGRTRQSNLHLPPRMRMRKGRYYYDTQGKPRRELPLGADYGTALAKWAELEGGNHSTLPTFGHAAKRYMNDVLPTKAPRRPGRRRPNPWP